MKHCNIADSKAASQLTNTLPRRLPGCQAGWLNGNVEVGLIQQAGCRLRGSGLSERSLVDHVAVLIIEANN